MVDRPKTVHRDTRPVIAITMGDAAGIGPEVVARALLSEDIHRICRPLVIGETGVMERAASLAGREVRFRRVNLAAEVEGTHGTVDILDMRNLDVGKVVFGRVSAVCGKAAMEYIDEAARMALQGEVGAIVTAPINKEATALGGYADVGHLEFLARITGAREYATMLVSGRLRAVHLTTHHSLAEACTLVTKARITGRLKLTHDSFRQWGFERPRVGVAALNPHGGESGLMGREEIDEIIPAVEEARAGGVDARGPFPADSIFNRAVGGEFDAVLAMYHDQGHIAIKVFGFEKSVSVAMGLPFVRTSVDHGTAFDIAGKGIADSRSMEEAIRVAVSLTEKGKLTADSL
ncbi:MAG: 4-hydroxythreonine-4-phosphate dehydrogenase PdxA [Chloroflexi bacterium RBG_16_57_8]|nr:MAG: 4-hydroxythreonine-4-phosphate dehydrogenase PdxA [Chloroflexi bacterium RBG_16_57_8]